MPRLVLQSGGKGVGVYPIGDDPVTLGRSSECTVCVDEVGISPNHARILRRGASCVLTDEGSQAGTFVNGRSVRNRVLQPGDIIAIGRKTLRFETKGDPPSAEGEASGAPGADAAFLAPTVKIDTGVWRVMRRQSPAPPADPGPPADPVPAGRSAFLVEVEGQRPHSLAEGEALIGKAPNCRIRISGFGVGQWAAVVFQQGEEFWVARLRGLRPVRVNGRRVQRNRLENGDLLQIGPAKMQFLVRGSNP